MEINKGKNSYDVETKIKLPANLVIVTGSVTVIIVLMVNQLLHTHFQN